MAIIQAHIHTARVVSNLPRNKSMFHPVNDDLKHKHKDTVRRKNPEPLLSPHILLHGLQDHNEEQDREM